MFPHQIKVEGYDWDHNEIEEKLYNDFGYPHGECTLCEREWYCGDDDEATAFFLDYPQCADIDHDAYKEFEDWLIKWSKERNYSIEPYDTKGQYGVDGFLLDHSHYGTWKQTGGGKIGYDYYLYTYKFRRQKDLAYFLLKHAGTFKIYKERPKPELYEEIPWWKNIIQTTYTKLTTLI